MLDLMLPDTDGLVLTTALKMLTNAPIIICSARQEQVDRVLGLKLGADDFIAKPFELDELEARIEAVLRRASRVREVPGGASGPDPRRRAAHLAVARDGHPGRPVGAPDADRVSPARRAGQSSGRGAIARNAWASWSGATRTWAPAT